MCVSFDCDFGIWMLVGLLVCAICNVADRRIKIFIWLLNKCFQFEVVFHYSGQVVFVTISSFRWSMSSCDGRAPSVPSSKIKQTIVLIFPVCQIVQIVVIKQKCAFYQGPTAFSYTFSLIDILWWFLHEDWEFVLFEMKPRWWTEGLPPFWSCKVWLGKWLSFCFRVLIFSWN